MSLILKSDFRNALITTYNLSQLNIIYKIDGITVHDNATETEELINIRPKLKLVSSYESLIKPLVKENDKIYLVTLRNEVSHFEGSIKVITEFTFVIAKDEKEAEDMYHNISVAAEKRITGDNFNIYGEICIDAMDSKNP